MLLDDLRAFARDPKGYPDSAAGHLCTAAADEIERLRKALTAAAVFKPMPGASARAPDRC